MILRLDYLLDDLRNREAEILAAIDADPLLIRRAAGPLVIANAGAMLFTPQAQHQLYAKGIVYRREPWSLVSLPLIKIYNLGERDVTATELAELAADSTARLHFLRKFDGTMIQRFQSDGRVYFTTRGMIEGGPAAGVQDEETPERTRQFDFLGTARRLARVRYPVLCEPHPELEGLSLVFEFLHPETRIITNYGDREDLVLLACFDRFDWRYRTYSELKSLAEWFQLSLVDELRPAGGSLAEQIDSLLATTAGTDQEGAVIAIEHGHRVAYRVKVKSPDYLRVMKLMVTCTYARTVEMLDAHPEWNGWPDLEVHLRGLGREHVPEEVLGFYREHYEVHAAYLADCERLRSGAQTAAAILLEEARSELSGQDDPRLLRKAFATLALKRPLSPLLFAAFDDRLSIAGIRLLARTPAEAREAVQRIRE
jgi:hypothetical protein